MLQHGVERRRIHSTDPVKRGLPCLRVRDVEFDHLVRPKRLQAVGLAVAEMARADVNAGSVDRRATNSLPMRPVAEVMRTVFGAIEIAFFGGGAELAVPTLPKARAAGSRERR